MARPNYSSPARDREPPRKVAGPAADARPLSAGGRGGGHEGRCPAAPGSAGSDTESRPSGRRGLALLWELGADGVWRGNGALFVLGWDVRTLPPGQVSAARTEQRARGEAVSPRKPSWVRQSGAAAGPPRSSGTGVRAHGRAGEGAWDSRTRSHQEKGNPPGSHRQRLL